MREAVAGVRIAGEQFGDELVGLAVHRRQSDRLAAGRALEAGGALGAAHALDEARDDVAFLVGHWDPRGLCLSGPPPPVQRAGCRQPWLDA
jgi:hypothetical protein